MTAVRVLVVDDDPMVCSYLADSLRDQPQVEVTGTAHDGAGAVEAVVRDRPDVVLMDIRMPGMDGIAATRELRSDDDPPAVLLMTTVDTDALIVEGLSAGATGFVLKTAAVDLVAAAVVAAAAGATVLSPAVTDRLLELGRGSVARASDPRLRDLAPRELDVLVHVGLGRSNAEIGRELHLAESTVKGHVSRLMAVLHCANRTQLAVQAPRPPAR